MVSIHPRVAWQIVSDQAVLLNLETGTALGLNETGSFLWSRLASVSESQLAAELCTEFCVEREQAEADVASFLAQLRGFLEP